jgi:hypothetical protein
MLGGQQSQVAASARLEELEVWCGTVDANVDDLTCERRRRALDALGSSVKV